MAWWNRRGIIIMLTVGAGTVLLASVFVLKTRPSAQSLFQTVVVRPIPESVKNIQADQLRSLPARDRVHTYILRFAVGKEDLSKILASDTFTKLGYAKYLADSLHFGLALDGGSHIIGRGIDLYTNWWHREPRWFDLGEWADFKAYIVEQEVPECWYKARLLLYHERIGAAYFIEQEMTGSWGGTISVTGPRSGGSVKAEGLGDGSGEWS